MTDHDTDGAPPGDPLIVDSRRLRRTPGASLRLRVHTLTPSDLRNDVMAVPAGHEVAVALLLESVLDGILVTGSADLPEHGVCVRCLDPIDRVVPVSFRQFFVYPGAEPEGLDEDDQDVTRLRGDWLDLRPAFRDAAVLALPLSPICRPDCPGLCAECGFRMADDPGHGHEHSDPRWSSLAALRDNLRDPEGE